MRGGQARKDGEHYRGARLGVLEEGKEEVGEMASRLGEEAGT